MQLPHLSSRLYGARGKRKVGAFVIPYSPYDDAVLPKVQGIRTFSSETEMYGWMGY